MKLYYPLDIRIPRKLVQRTKSQTAFNTQMIWKRIYEFTICN